MNELLREAARHLRHAASENGAPDYCAVVVITIGQDGTADSLFFGDEDAAETAAHSLPHIAADFVGQLSGVVGFTTDSPEIRGECPTDPAGRISAERITAQAIRKAKREFPL